jgi:hypothetical protein
VLAAARVAQSSEMRTNGLDFDFMGIFCVRLGF